MNPHARGNEPSMVEIGDAGVDSRQQRLQCIVVGNGTLARYGAEHLFDRGHDVVAVVSDDPELAQWARESGVSIVPVGDGSGRAWNLPTVDVLFSIANLTLLGPAALALGRRAAINFHDGPLPAYAGLNVPSWAILHGETTHGVTWHAMTTGIDDGDVFITESFAIEENDTARTLNAKCFDAGLRTFRTLIARLEEGRWEATPQPEARRRVFRRAQRPSAGGWLDPGRSAAELARMARALDYGTYPNPLARPVLVTATSAVIVNLVSVLAEDGKAQPGQVLEIDEGIRLRTTEGEVLLGGFERHDGESLSAAVAAQALGLRVGDRVEPLDDTVLRDFDEAARRWLTHEEYWERRIAAAEPCQAAYVRHARPASPSGSVASHVVSFAPEEVRAASVEPGTALLGAVLVLLARLEGRPVLDVPLRCNRLADVAGRAARQFSSHVPLRVDIAEDRSFGAYLEGVEALLDEAANHGSFLRDLGSRRPGVRGIDPSWGRQRWDVTVAVGDTALDDEPVSAMDLVVATDGRTCTIRFDPAVVDARAVERFAGRLRAVTITLAGGASTHTADLLSDEDRSDIVAWNETQARRPNEASIHHAFDGQVARTPNATAVVASDETLSYQDLRRRANGLAHELLARGVKRGDRVGIMTERTAEMIVALLAVLKAGAAYVPLDPAFPPERVSFMIEDADLVLVLTDRANASHVPIGTAPVVSLSSLRGGADEPPDVLVDANDLAYVIYTSGSTGRPKGVMLEHGNVLSFMAGMDQRLGVRSDPGTWLAVTSISFDISVLELLWTLARGFTVVLYAGEPRRAPKPTSVAHHEADAQGDSAMPTHSARRSAAKSTRFGREAPEFSLFYFSADEGTEPGAKYRLLLEGARFADTHGFTAVWTPERHFHAFGGLYPNPAVTGAAVAAITERVRIRAGSCVLPLHHPVRVAEDWAVVDNLSGGRVDISFASGWQPNDFILAPDAYQDRNGAMYRGIETVRALWRGETLTFDGPNGQKVDVATLPRPVQSDLPVWVTAAGNPATFRAAGEIGANVLTHMLGQDLGQLADKVRVYREAWVAAGHPGRGHVSLMLHTFVSDDTDHARAVAREPLRGYLRSSAGLMKQFASTFPAFRGTDTADRDALDERFRSLTDEDMEALLDHAFERYYDTSGLFGTVDDAMVMVRNVADTDVDEIACLIDFGIPVDDVLAGLRHLADLREHVTADGGSHVSIPELIEAHGVTHMQCTPSMAQMLITEPHGRTAIASLEMLLVGGEAFPRELARTLTALVDGPVLNMYGPTETTIWSTVQRLDEDSFQGQDAVVSIGTPIANTQVYVCSEDLRLLPPGVPGELVIGGPGVARGYWKRPEVTAERFVNDGFASTIGLERGGKAYRTGDLVRWNADGTIAYLGRLDFQVKIRGHRIELGEIEAVLDEHPHVVRAVVAAHPSDMGDLRLVAYVQPLPGAALQTHEIRRYVAERLPDVMVPSAVMVMEVFPLTPNKKVDRNALPRPVFGAFEEDGYVAPTSDLEKLLASVWQRVLSVERVGIHDDFFSIGGNSLLAVFLTSEVGKHGLSMTLADLLREPTVAGLSHLIEAGRNAAARDSDEPVRPGTP